MPDILIGIPIGLFIALWVLLRIADAHERAELFKRCQDTWKDYGGTIEEDK